jgi:hypothetical protein
MLLMLISNLFEVIDLDDLLVVLVVYLFDNALPHLLLHKFTPNNKLIILW